MQSRFSSLEFDDSLELDEIDRQHYEQCLGPKLRSSIIKRSQDEMNPTVWAEVLKQDVNALRRFLDVERESLRTFLHQIGSIHRDQVNDSLVLIRGFKLRYAELEMEMAKWNEEFPTNPTLIEGVIAHDENTGNAWSKTELRHSKKMVMELLHRPDVLNFKERKEHHLVHSKLGGGIYDPPHSNWDGTRYKNTLIVSLRTKLALKIHFQGLAHMAAFKRNARKACNKYRHTRSRQILKLCFQSLRFESLDSQYTYARSHAAARMMEQQKYLYPAVHTLGKMAMHRRHNLNLWKRADRFGHWWYLIRGYSKLERYHQILMSTKEAYALSKRHAFRKFSKSSLEALHEYRRLMISLRTMDVTVHKFRMETAGKTHFRALVRHTWLRCRLQECHQLVKGHRLRLLLQRPWELFRVITREIAEERIAYEAGILHRRAKMSYVLISTLGHFYWKRQALRKWRSAGQLFHTRKCLSRSMHHLTRAASFCLYAKICRQRGSYFYLCNAFQDTLSIFKIRVKCARLTHLAEIAALNRANQRKKREGLKQLKACLALSRRARLLSKWAPERGVRSSMLKSYHAWIYAYVKRCAVKITLQKQLQKQQDNLKSNPRDALKLRQAADWKEEMMHLDRHRSDEDILELEHSLIQLRAHATIRLEESRAEDFAILKAKLKAVRALGAPQVTRQIRSELNYSILDKAFEAVGGKRELEQEELGLASYLHAFNRHNRTRNLVNKLPLVFYGSNSLFEECVSKRYDGVISGFNVGPGLRPGFAGTHASGQEAAGTLSETFVKSGIQLMKTDIHKPRVEYHSHLPAHHVSHAKHLVGQGSQEINHHDEHESVHFHQTSKIYGQTVAEPHYLQTTAAVEGHEAGHVHIPPHMRAETDLSHSTGISFKTSHVDAQDHAVHHPPRKMHELRAEIPNYTLSTSSSEQHSTSRSPLEASGTEPETRGTHTMHTDGTRARKNTNKNVKKTNKSKSHKRSARHSVDDTSTSDTHNLDQARSVGISDTMRRSQMGVSRPPDYPTQGDQHTSTEKSNRVRVTRHTGYKPTQDRQTEQKALSPHSRLKYHPDHPDARHQHRIRARKGYTDSLREEHNSDLSSDSEDLEDWMRTTDISQIISRNELYRSVETSTDDSTEACDETHEVSRSMSRTSRTSPNSIWSRNQYEIRADMAVASTTDHYRKVNQKNPSSLVRFFRSAVSLGASERKKRKASSSHSRKDKSTYLLERGGEETSTMRDKKGKRLPDSVPVLHSSTEQSSPLKHSGGVGMVWGDSGHDGVGADLLERSLNLSLLHGTSPTHGQRLEASFNEDDREGDDNVENYHEGNVLPHRSASAGLETSGISLIEDDEDEQDTHGMEEDPVIHSDPHTAVMFRDPESRQRRRLEMFEVVGNLDEALRLVTESRWALNKLRRHAFLSKSTRIVRRGNVKRRLLYCIRGWVQLHIKKLEQLRLCETIFRRKALSRTVRHLHYFGYLRLRSLSAKLFQKSLHHNQRCTLRKWWKETLIILNGQRVGRRSRQHVLRRKFAAWVWCVQYLPGMGAVRRKVTRRVCAPLIHRWRMKTKRRKKLKRAFTIFDQAWSIRAERTIFRSAYLRQSDVFNAWKVYLTIAQEERIAKWKRESAFVFRGTVLVSRCWYNWLAFHGRAQAAKKAALRQQHMKQRLIIEAIKMDAIDTRLAIVEARNHRSFFLRLHAFLLWQDHALERRQVRPRTHYRMHVFRLFWDELRTAGREQVWHEDISVKQQQNRMKGMLRTWKAVVIRRMRVRIGLGKLHDTWVRHLARVSLITWPGRASFAKGEAMRRRLEEKGRARIVLVDNDDADRRRKDEEKRRKREEEERKARSFIQFRRNAPIQQRAQLLGIIYSMDDPRAVANLFTLLRTVMVMWSDTAHTEKLLRGKERLVVFRHKRFLVEHHLRKWINRCSATSHRVALWIQAKYQQKHSQKMSEATSAIATQRLVEEYAHMDVEPGLHTTIGGVVV